MKKILLAVLMFVFAVSASFAQSRGRSVLKLRLSDRTPLSVNVDGRHFDQGTNVLTIGNLPAGPHRIEVFSEGGRGFRARRVYTGTVRMSSDMVYIGTIDLNNRGMRLRTRPMEGYVQSGPGTGRDDDEYRDEKGDRYSIPGKDRDDRYNGDDVYGDNRSGNYHDDDNRDNDEYGSDRGSDRGNTYGTANSITQRDMTDLSTRVKTRITDTDKEQLMKTVMEKRTASTNQIREMLGWLSFESTRLDFAKWAYSRATDRQNYWKLEDVFSFSSSKEEFNKAIRGR